VTTDQKGKGIRFPLDERIHLVHLNIDFDGHFSENLFRKYVLHQRKIKIYKKRLVRLIEELDITICISLCGKEIDFLASLPVKCKKIGEIHFAMNVRKQFLTAHHKGYIWEFLGAIRTLQLKKATKGLDRLVVLTKADQEQWEQTHQNIIQIPNPNPLVNTQSSTLINKRVISVGKLDAQKGYDILVEAWKLVAVKHPDWVLTIFGEGPWESMLGNRIKELDLVDQIKLHRNITDVVSQYLNSSIYVMSSRYEGLPMVLIEAMSCGLPIVSFDCEFGPRELIIDGESGLLVPPDNLEQLAEKICILIEDENLRKKMGVKALEGVSKYAKEPIMHKWIEFFDQIN